MNFAFIGHPLIDIYFSFKDTTQTNEFDWWRVLLVNSNQSTDDATSKVLRSSTKYEKRDPTATQLNTQYRSDDLNTQQPTENLFQRELKVSDILENEEKCARRIWIKRVVFSSWKPWRERLNSDDSVILMSKKSSPQYSSRLKRNQTESFSSNIDYICAETWCFSSENWG